MIWLFKKDDARLRELEALVIQQGELLEKLREENEKLRRKLADAERRLESTLKLFFPKLYHEKKPSSLEEMITVLVDGLDELRNKVSLEATRETIVQQAAKLQEEAKPFVDVNKIRIRLEKLEDEEKQALKLVLMGYCTVKSLRKELGIGKSKAERILDKLHRQGFLDVLRVTTRIQPKGYKVYFPSPHGEAASEVLLGMPWSMLHIQVLHEKSLYMDNEKLIKESEMRLKHAGYKVITEFENPSECVIKYSMGTHRADLVIYGEKAKIFMECESMSNPLAQVCKMLDAHYEYYKKIYIVVSSSLAKRMMIQRICYWAWKKRQPEGLVIEAKIEAVDRLTRLSAMSTYIINRPPSK